MFAYLRLAVRLLPNSVVVSIRALAKGDFMPYFTTTTSSSMVGLSRRGICVYTKVNRRTYIPRVDRTDLLEFSGTT